MRDPADARGIRAVSTLAHGAIELLLEAAQERPRLVTNDSHNCSPVGMLETKRKPCAVAQDVWLGRRGFKSRGFVAEARADPSTEWRRGVLACGQAVQNLCFVWAQDIGVGPRFAKVQFLKKSRRMRRRISS